MISPGRASGANIADRVPMTTSHVAAANAMPLVVPLAVGQAAVLNRDAPRQIAREMLSRPPASARSPEPASARRGRSPHAIGELQVDLGLAAAGHAVQQRDLKARVARPAHADWSTEACLISGRASVGRR